MWGGADDGRAMALRRFPGPVAVVLAPAATPRLTFEEVDHEPWAVQIEYHDATGLPLVVRTVRSTSGLSPRGLPVEDIPSVMLTFLLAGPGPVPGLRPARPGEPDLDAVLRSRSRALMSSRAALERLVPSATGVTIDGRDLRARRVDAPACVGLHVPWLGQNVFCAVLPEFVGALQLRTGGVEELSHFP